MAFNVTISGQIVDSEQSQVEAKEQAISDALKNVLAQFKADVTVATATFDYSGTTDLTAAPESGGGGGTPGAFVMKEAGESYLNAQERVFTYNSTRAVADQAQLPSENDWNALPVG